MGIFRRHRDVLVVEHPLDRLVARRGRPVATTVEPPVARFSFSPFDLRSARVGARGKFRGRPSKWASSLPVGRIGTSAARTLRRGSDDLEQRLGVSAHGDAHGVPGRPRYRPPGDRDKGTGRG